MMLSASTTRLLLRATASSVPHVDVEQQKAQPCDQVVQECPDQADQDQLHERMGDGGAITHVGIG